MVMEECDTTRVTLLSELETQARISHQHPAAACGRPMPTSLRSVGVLDVLFKYASARLGRAPRIHGPRAAPRDGCGEKYGLVTRVFDEPRELVFDEYVALQGEYCEIERPVRLVYRLIPEGRQDRRALVTVEFEQAGRQTKLTERILHQTVEDRNESLCAGAAERLNKLGERLRAIEEERSESVVVAEAHRRIAV